MKRITLALAAVMLLTGMHAQSHAETLAQDQQELLRLQIRQAELDQRLMREYIRCVQIVQQTNGVGAYAPQYQPGTETIDDFCRRQAIDRATSLTLP
jgi:hypothetical protein